MPGARSHSNAAASVGGALHARTLSVAVDDPSGLVTFICPGLAGGPTCPFVRGNRQVAGRVLKPRIATANRDGVAGKKRVKALALARPNAIHKHTALFEQLPSHGNF